MRSARIGVNIVPFSALRLETGSRERRSTDRNGVERESDDRWSRSIGCPSL